MATSVGAGMATVSGRERWEEEEEDSDDDGPPVGKLRKVEQHQLTEVDLKDLLRDPNTAFAALGRFVEMARNYPETESYDIVARYCESSNECFEIFKLLETDFHKKSECILIISTLECLLVRIIDDLREFSSTGEALVRRVLLAHMHIIYWVLNAKNNSKHIKLGLKLLTAMVMLGGNFAEDVLMQFDFTQECFWDLFDRQNIKDSQDVRSCLLHFLMSFLHSNNDTVINQLLEKRGILRNIFKGMKYDTVSVVQLVLSTFMDKVVKNLKVKGKWKIFNGYILTSLAFLYCWCGPRSSCKITGFNVDSPSNREEELGVVRSLVHTFLLTVFCSPVYGIIIKDPSHGTSGKDFNQMLPNFFVTMINRNRCLEDNLMAELLVQILQVCPEHIHSCLSLLQNMAKPRLSPNWLNYMNFLEMVMKSQPDIPPPFHSSQKLPVATLLELCKIFIFPSPQILQPIGQSLGKSEIIVRHTALRYLSLILHKCFQVIHYCKENFSFSWTQGASELEKFLVLFKDYMQKHFPEVNQIFFCWTMLLENKDTQTTRDKECAVKEGLNSVNPVEHAILIEQVLCLYQEFFPLEINKVSGFLNLVMEGVARLCQSSNTSQVAGDSESVNVGMVRLCLLKLLAETAAGKLQWRAMNGKHSLMYLLLDMLLEISANKKFLVITKELIIKLLSGTGLFEHNVDELSLWLNCLLKNEDGNKREILTFLDQLFTTFILNPHPNIDKVFDLMVESTALVTSGDNVEEPVSLTTADSVMDAAALELDGDWQGVIEQKRNTKTTWASEETKMRLPFTPLIVVAINMAENVTEKNVGVGKYLEMLLVELLHLQVDPVPLSFLVSRCKGEWLDAKVASYLTSWLPQNKVPKHMWNSSFSRKNFTHLMMMFHSDESVLEKDKDFQMCLLESIGKLELDGCFRAMKHILQCVTCSVNQFEKGVRINEDHLQLYFCLLREIIQCISGAVSQKLMNSFDMSDMEHLQENLTIFQVKATSQDAVFMQILQLLRENAAIRKWFVYVPGKDEKVNAPLLKIQTLTHIITMETADLIIKVPKFKDSQSLMSLMFADKIQAFLTSCCSKRNEEIGGRDNVYIVARVLDSLMEWFDLDVILDITEKLLQLPKTFLMVSKHELSVIGSIVFKILNHLLSQKPNFSIEYAGLVVVFSLLRASNSEEAESTCLSLLHSHPHYSLACKPKVFLHLLNKGTASSNKLAAILILNPSFQRVLEEWINDSEKLEAGKEKFMDVVCHWWKFSNSLPQASREIYLQKISKIYQKSLLSWFKSSSGELLDASQSEATFLLEMISAGTIKKKKLLRATSELMERLREGEIVSVPRMRVLLKVLGTMELGDCETVLLGQNMVTPLLACMHCLINGLARKDRRDQKLECYLLSVLEMLTQDLQHNQMDVVSPLWHTFIKRTLRHYYEDVRLLRSLIRLVPHIYGGDSEISPTLETLYELMISHSMFLPTIMDEKRSPAKEALADFLFCVVELNPRCCRTSHFNMLLGAYNATLSMADQKLLKLICFYERHDAVLTDYKPYLWGLQAAERRRTLNKAEPSLLFRDVTMVELLENLDADNMYQSVLHFPLRRKLTPTDAQPAEVWNSSSQYYDPCFLLPLFSHLLAPEALVACNKFIEKNCLAYTIAALSSHDSRLRSAAYLILCRFLFHLEGSVFRWKAQYLCFLEFVKNSIEVENAKLPCVITIFLAHLSQLLLHVEDHMYPILISVLRRPRLNTSSFPDFFRLFNFSSAEFRKKRNWILSLMTSGLREIEDYRIFEKVYILKIILSFHDSSVSEMSSRLQILRIVRLLCTHRIVAFVLTNRYGILLWLDNVIRNADVHQVPFITDILHTLWTSLLSKRDRNQQLPANFIQEVQLTLFNLLRHYGTRTAYRSQKLFLSLLLSVLEQTNTESVTIASLTVREVGLLLVLASSVTEDKDAYGHAVELLQEAGYTTSDDDIFEQKKPNMLPPAEAGVDENFIVLTCSEKAELLQMLIKIFQCWDPCFDECQDGNSVLISAMVLVVVWSSRQVVKTPDFTLVSRTLSWIHQKMENSHFFLVLVHRIFVQGGHESCFLDSMLASYGRLVNQQREGVTLSEELRVLCKIVSKLVTCGCTVFSNEETNLKSKRLLPFLEIVVSNCT